MRRTAKRALTALLAALLLTPAAGCANTGSVPEEETEFVPSWESPDYSDFEMPGETDSLVIYTQGFESMFLSEAVAVFKKTFPDVTLEYKIMEQDEYLAKIRAEIPAGTGLDLMFAMLKDLPDVYKSMSTGLFEDLNPYFGADPDTDLSDFNEGVMNGGVMRERRYFAPVMYNLNMLLTTRENLADSGIGEKDLAAYDGFLDACAGYKEKNPDNHLFAEGVLLGTDFNYLRELYDLTGVRMIDYDRERVSLGEESFRKLMDVTKLWYKKGRPDINEGSAEKLMTDRHCLFSTQMNSSEPGIFLSMHVVRELGETPLLLAVPNADNGVTAEILYYVAIPGAAANRRNAWEFLKILLSDAVQTGNEQAADAWGVNKFLGLSPREGSERKRCDLAQKLLPLYNPRNDPVLVNVTDGDKEMLLGLTARVTDSALLPPVLFSYLKDNMEPYLRKKADFEECFGKLMNELELYKDE